jgi:hypothetical protein
LERLAIALTQGVMPEFDQARPAELFVRSACQLMRAFGVQRAAELVEKRYARA